MVRARGGNAVGPRPLILSFLSPGGRAGLGLRLGGRGGHRARVGSALAATHPPPAQYLRAHERGKPEQNFRAGSGRADLGLNQGSAVC